MLLHRAASLARMACIVSSVALVLTMPAQRCEAAVTVLDDAQRQVSLAQPAQRIVSLAPHITELLFEAGAGKNIVAVTDYSDYPEAAKKLPSIGNIFALDLERLLALKPDLVIIWGTGNAKILANKLRQNHITVFESEPHDFEMIATSLERFSILAGTSAVGKPAADAFRKRLDGLRKTYQPASSKPISVFYQMVRKPLMTLNDDHMVSSAIRLCGGRNVFGKLKELSSTITTEAVLAANPDVMLTTGESTEALQDWLAFPVLTAVRKQQFYTIKADLLNRAGPRILDGTEILCKHLTVARSKSMNQS
ncbi:cobalamin-binding protein [Undibacterium sp. SXout7W]|uniref:cobalamin-binding protein n=1 Tax=Undibacterium sp. SXout7W TaxID=3413049 RepID=UPI003BF3DF59